MNMKSILRTLLESKKTEAAPGVRTAPVGAAAPRFTDFLRTGTGVFRTPEGSMDVDLKAVDREGMAGHATLSFQNAEGESFYMTVDRDALLSLQHMLATRFQDFDVAEKKFREAYRDWLAVKQGRKQYVAPKPVIKPEELET